MELTKAVEDSLMKWEKIWEHISTQPIKKTKKLNALRQLWNYIRIKRISKKCYRILKKTDDPNELMAKMENDALTLVELLLGVDRSECSDLMKKTYGDATKQFINEAKAFDPNMEPESIFQALRNVWIMHSIQVLMGMEPKHSPSIFGYSMLYPLSDNLLDDPDISKTEKKAFNYNFRKKLEGHKIETDNKSLQDVFDMVEKMESEYDREGFPQVWESILMIQSAQENSLKQQGNAYEIKEDYIRSLSFRKGGTSVLADGYLVNGELNEAWVHFLLGYGILLQLADDLQDLYGDAEDGHWTLFSIHHRSKDVDLQVQKLRNLTQLVLESCPSRGEASNAILLKVMQGAVDYLIYDATIHVRRNCKRSYISLMEREFPVNANQQLKLNVVWKSLIDSIEPSEINMDQWTMN